MGFSREEVCMALAALGTSADKDNEVRALITLLSFTQAWEYKQQCGLNVWEG